MVGFTFSGDLAGIRTQDPLLKREMLYQLSYQVGLAATKAILLNKYAGICARGCKYNIINLLF